MEHDQVSRFQDHLYCRTRTAPLHAHHCWHQQSHPLHGPPSSGPPQRQQQLQLLRPREDPSYPKKPSARKALPRPSCPVPLTRWSSLVPQTLRVRRAVVSWEALRVRSMIHAACVRMLHPGARRAFHLLRSRVVLGSCPLFRRLRRLCFGFRRLEFMDGSWFGASGWRLLRRLWVHALGSQLYCLDGIPPAITRVVRLYCNQSEIKVKMPPESYKSLS